jgi:hypothetical protein
MIGLALLYPPRKGAFVLLTILDIRRACDLIFGKALRGRLGHQITDATARPLLNLLNLTWPR